MAYSEKVDMFNKSHTTKFIFPPPPQLVSGYAKHNYIFRYYPYILIKLLSEVALIAFLKYL